MENSMCDRPDMDDLPHHDWKCQHCGALNSTFDPTCQYCDADDAEDYRSEEDSK